MSKPELNVAFACDTEDNHPNYVPGWTKWGSNYEKNPAFVNWKWTKYWSDLSKCFSTRNVPVTWLMRVDDGPVYDQMLTLFKEKILELKFTGDEIGIHIHTWSWNPKFSKWVQTINPADEAKIVTDSLAMFKKTLGFVPLSASMGWHTMSNEIMRTLDANGLTVDASAIPKNCSLGKFEKRDNIYDWSRAPTTPYNPSPTDYQSPGNMEILEAPISSLASNNSNNPRMLSKIVTKLSNQKSLAILLPLARRLNFTPHNNLYITPWWSSSVYNKIISTYCKKAHNEGMAFLIGTFHPCDIFDPKTGNKNIIFEKYIAEVLNTISSLEGIKVNFMNLSEIAKRIKEKSTQLSNAK
jgi:hypothetical protein